MLDDITSKKEIDVIIKNNNILHIFACTDMFPKGYYIVYNQKKDEIEGEEVFKTMTDYYNKLEEVEKEIKNSLD